MRALPLLLLGALISSAQSAPDFTQKIWPILSERCLACHGDKPEKLKGGLDLRTREAALKGGDSGEPTIVPGAPEKSGLYLAITRTHEPDWKPMPPKENDKLSPEQIELLRAWIGAGAPWGETKLTHAADSDTGLAVKTSGGLTETWTNRRYQPEDLWAYQPIRRGSPPPDSALIDPAAAHNEIDRFIQAGLKAKGLTRLAPPADPRTFLRRATFDLTGLPPASGEVESNDRLIDRLLASAAYGEQQGRHWLDVVRYADTGGFSNDFERPNAWRYRDYVIRSFNADKPYDRFVSEQLAGDELWPDDPEMLIATGFLRMGPWEHTGMTVAAVTRQDFLDDVTQHVGVTLLGQGLRCARCHDHKFDPVPTRDYYRIQSVFASTQFAERRVPFLPQENVSGFDAGREMAAQRLEQVQAQQTALRQKGEEALAKLLADRGVKSLDELPAADRPKKDYLGPLLGLTKTDLTLRKVTEKSRAYLERELKRFEPFAFSVYSGGPSQYTSVKPFNAMPAGARGGVVPPLHILTGGSLEAPAEEVQPGVLSAMMKLGGAPVPDTAEGRRSAFARWVCDRENTLAARVIVNRAWQQHFGTGLVATPNNFGKMGAKPSHPELLDWLATWFIDHDWSLKALHRLIMQSATYQQSGEHPDFAKLHDLDSRNALLAYYPARRLAAEELRDAMLSVSGELNPEMGGPGIFPEINWEVAFQPRHIMGSVAPAYLPSRTARERNRRTIYAFRYRTLADPLLEVFNRPGSEISCERRDQTTITPQAFALLNSEFAQARALACAASITKAAPDLQARIAGVFQRTYGRAPTDAERQACTAHFEKSLAAHTNENLAPRQLPTSIRRHMVEELTGETVYWDEDLSPLAKYESDLQPSQVTAETRALADLCLVLLNSNEFLYVR
jgi:mono/diheme cytochrome c family protein